MQELKKKIESIKKTREGILRKYLNHSLFQSSLKDVKRVLIINASSRSGSSLLYALLRKLPQIYSLTGEAAPFYKLNTCFDDFNMFESDKISEDTIAHGIDYEGLSRDFFSDMYKPNRHFSLSKEIDIEAYSDHLILRFFLQWTAIDFDVATLKTLIYKAFEAYSTQSIKFSTDDFYLCLLKEMCLVYPEINPFYYDISTEKVALHFPGLVVPSAPPNKNFNIEEPPFILLSPGVKADTDDLKNKILLLKSTVDCYRMNLIEKIFPEAEIRIIHLVRNPAATINGLYDGWLHRGFFSHNLFQKPYDGHDLKKLSIKGYSDIFLHGSHWWNFDLPEGWQAVADKDLVDVCAFQWFSANAEILKYFSSGSAPFKMFHFENIVRNISSRNETFTDMLDFTGIPASETDHLHLNKLPVVQSTLPPQLFRWKKREDIILRILNNPKILDMCSKLGYNTENREEWL